MELNKKEKPKIVIHDKEFELEGFHISELGYLMMRLYSDSDKRYLTYNMGEYNKDSNIFNQNLLKNEKK
jgi:hypothetical protein